MVRVWWPQTFYPADVCILSSWVNNGRVLLGESAVSSSMLNIRMDYLIYWSEMLWHWKKITQVVATSYLLIESCSWSGCASLRICEMFCLLCCAQHLSEIHRDPISLSWTKMSPVKINVMTWLQFVDYSSVHINI